MTLVLGHRGAPEAARENTIEAFLAAKRLGCDGVELDVRLASDGAMVVHHDPVVEGVGAIHQLRVADLPPWVPLLADAIEACEGMVLNVEIKNLPTEEGWDQDESLASMVASGLAESGRRENTVVSSFTPATIEAVRRADPGLECGWLTLAADAVFAEQAAEMGCVALHPAHQSVSEAAVEGCHRLGLAVSTWTVDAPDRIRELSAMGVDSVITNRPQVALEALAGSGKPGLGGPAGPRGGA